MLIRIAVVLLLMLPVTVAVQAQPLPTDSARVVERFLDAYRALDVERMMGSLSPAVRFEDPTSRLSANGHAELRQMTSQLTSSYRDIEIAVHSITADAGRVAVELTIAAVVTRRMVRRGIFASAAPPSFVCGTGRSRHGRTTSTCRPSVSS